MCPCDLKLYVCYDWALAISNLPASSHIKRASPMPIGARKVSFDFSAASMRMTKTSSAVMNISINNPFAVDVSADNKVLTAKIWSLNIAAASPPAHMDASSCAGMRKAVRAHGSCPARLKPKDTYALEKCQHISPL